MGRLPQQMTTSQLKAMIGKGATLSDVRTATGGTVISDGGDNAYQERLAHLARTDAFLEKTYSLTGQDARDIISGKKPRISDTPNVYFTGDNRDQQIDDYFRGTSEIIGDYFRSDRNPDVFTVGKKQTELREELSKTEFGSARVKPKEKTKEIEIINYDGLKEDKLTPVNVIVSSVQEIKKSKDKIPQNSNNQEILLDLAKSNDKKEIADDIIKQTSVRSGLIIASALVSGIVIYFKVLKK